MSATPSQRAAAVAREWQEGMGFTALARDIREAIEAALADEAAERPRRICLCGSTRFKEAYERANREETLQFRIVLSVGLLGHHEGLDMNGPVKAMLDQLHLAKIDLADEILVLNVGGYIGDSTRLEIEYATRQGKPVRYLEGHDA